MAKKREYPKIFINLNAEDKKKNIQYEIFRNEYDWKDELNEFEGDIDSYLQDKGWEQWMQLPITKENQKVLSELAGHLGYWVNKK